MLKTIGLFLLFTSANVFAQRLYLHDIANGNYQSYEVGSSIVLYMLDSSTKTQGTIDKLYQNSFFLTDGTYIQLEQIASILPPNKTKPIKRFVSLVGGAFILITGTVYFIAGAAMLAEDPVFGSGIMVISSGILVGGVYVLRKSKINYLEVRQAIIDNVNYRVFIE